MTPSILKSTAGWLAVLVMLALSAGGVSLEPVAPAESVAVSSDAASD